MLLPITSSNWSTVTFRILNSISVLGASTLHIWSITSRKSWGKIRLGFPQTSWHEMDLCPSDLGYVLLPYIVLCLLIMSSCEQLGFTYSATSQTVQWDTRKRHCWYCEFIVMTWLALSPAPPVCHSFQDPQVQGPEPPEAHLSVCPAEEEVGQRDQRAQTLHLPPADHR